MLLIRCLGVSTFRKLSTPGCWRGAGKGSGRELPCWLFIAAAAAAAVSQQGRCDRGVESVQVSGTSVLRELDANIGRTRTKGTPGSSASVPCSPRTKNDLQRRMAVASLLLLKFQANFSSSNPNLEPCRQSKSGKPGSS